MIDLNWNDGLTWELIKTYPKVVDLNWNDGMICGKCEKNSPKMVDLKLNENTTGMTWVSSKL